MSSDRDSRTVPTPAPSAAVTPSAPREFFTKEQLARFDEVERQAQARRREEARQAEIAKAHSRCAEAATVVAQLVSAGDNTTWGRIVLATARMDLAISCAVLDQLKSRHD